MMQIWATSCLEGNSVQATAVSLWEGDKRGQLFQKPPPVQHMDRPCGICGSIQYFFLHKLTLNNSYLWSVISAVLGVLFIYLFKPLTKCFLANHMCAIHQSNTLYLLLHNNLSHLHLSKPECHKYNPQEMRVFMPAFFYFCLSSAGVGAAEFGIQILEAPFLRLLHPLIFASVFALLYV